MARVQSVEMMVVSNELVADRAGWNQCSVTSRQLAREYGFTDLDGSQPDIWRYILEVREPGLDADLSQYR